jgi:hypothetical protein
MSTPPDVLSGMRDVETTEPMTFVNVVLAQKEICADAPVLTTVSTSIAGAVSVSIEAGTE